MPLATSNVNKLNCVLAANRINIIAFNVICVRRLFSLSYALHCLFFLPLSLFLPCFVHKMLPGGIVAGFAVYFYCWILMPRAAMCQLKLQLQNSHSNPLFLRLLLPFPVSLLAGTLIYSAWANSLAHNFRGYSSAAFNQFSMGQHNQRNLLLYANIIKNFLPRPRWL